MSFCGVVMVSGRLSGNAGCTLSPLAATPAMASCMGSINSIRPPRWRHLATNSVWIASHVAAELVTFVLRERKQCTVDVRDEPAST